MTGTNIFVNTCVYSCKGKYCNGRSMHDELLRNGS